MEHNVILPASKRLVIKVGTAVLTQDGQLALERMTNLVNLIAKLKNEKNLEVILVSSGAIGVGAKTIGLTQKPNTTSMKQACAAIGQGQLMMIYQKLFSEYQHSAAQVLLTFDVITSEERRTNSINTFNELLQLGAIPIVNENDTVATEEIEFGDNDTLSAIVAALTHADLLVLMSDIDGLYTDDPRSNPEAKLIHIVEEVTDEIKEMAKGASTSLGTGGMSTKIAAASIASLSGIDMVIMNGEKISTLVDLFAGEEIGTIFLSRKLKNFSLKKYIKEKQYLL